jgi:hypothetical protein
LFRAASCVTDHHLIVAEVRERLALGKQIIHIFDKEVFSLKNETRQRLKSSIVLRSQIGSQLWKALLRCILIELVPTAF